MPLLECVEVRAKSKEQLRKQVDAVSKRIGYSIVPASLGNDVYDIESPELQRRFPIHRKVYGNELRTARREEQGIFAAENVEKRKQTENIVRTWEIHAPLVENLNRHISAHQKREVEGVKFKERQMDIFEDIGDHIEDGDMEMTIQAPTGFGKTVVFNQLADAANVPTVIFVPTKDLVEQTYRRFQQFTPNLPVGRVYTDKKEYGRQVTITTYSSFLGGNQARLINPEGIGLVIFDEVHKAISERRVMRAETIEQFRNAVFVGLSATPVEIQDSRFENTRVAQMTKKICHVVSEREAIEEGYLSSFHSILARVNVDLSNVNITAGGDYKEKELDKAINTEIQNKAAVRFFLQKRGEDRIERQRQGKNPLPLTTSWYSASVAQAQEHARLLRESGVRAGAVWGTNNSREKEEHRRIMKQWENGEIEVVCSNMKLVEGLDIACIHCVMNVAPTASPIVEKQRSGRGLRLDENNLDKDTEIIDFVYMNSNTRSQQVIYSNLIDAARITRRDISTQSSPTDVLPVDHSRIQIDGIEVITDEEEIMRITNQIASQREENILIELIDKENEIGITTVFLSTTFIGDRKRIISHSNVVLAQILAEHPDSWRTARTINGSGRATTSFKALKTEHLPLYKQLMQERGIELQGATALIDQEHEVGITEVFLNTTFVGGNILVTPHSNVVLTQILAEHPDAWRKAVSMGEHGKLGRRIISLKNEFVLLYKELMQKRGITLNETIAQIDQEHEVGIIKAFLKTTFVGGDSKSSDSNAVLAQIIAEHPDAWRKARILDKNGKEGKLVKALKTEYLPLYLQLMQERGIRLR